MQPLKSLKTPENYWKLRHCLSDHFIGAYGLAINCEPLTVYKAQIWSLTHITGTTFHIKHEKSGKFISFDGQLSLQEKEDSKQQWDFDLVKKDGQLVGQISSCWNGCFLQMSGEHLICAEKPQGTEHIWTLLKMFTESASMNWSIPFFKPLIVAIDGVRRSGKTSLCKSLRNEFLYPVTMILSLDEYVNEAQSCRDQVGDFILEDFTTDILKIKENQRAFKSIVLVEGTELFKSKRFLQNVDFCVFLGISKDICKQRNVDEPNEDFEALWRRTIQYSLRSPSNVIYINGNSFQSEVIQNLAHEINAEIINYNQFELMIQEETPISQYPEILKDLAHGFVHGLAMGNILGMPYDPVFEKTREYSQIFEQRQKNDRDVYEIYNYKTNDGKYQQLPIGSYGNDTIISLAVWNALVGKSRLVMDDVAKGLKDLLKQNQIMLVGKTGEAFAALKVGGHWTKCGVDTAGNGALIRMIPLAFFYAQKTYVEFKDKLTDVSNLTTMTHNNKLAIAASGIMLEFVEYVFRNRHELATNISRKRAFTELIVRVPVILEACQISPQDERHFKRLYDLLELFDFLHIDAKVLSIITNPVFSIDTLCLIFGVIFGMEPSIHSVFRAAYLGGDSDLYGAIVGGIMGGIFGTSLFVGYGEYIEKIFTQSPLKQAADNFYDKRVSEFARTKK